MGSTSSVCVQLTLAKLAAKANKVDDAVQRYKEALRLAWWCWEAYEGLCALGDSYTVCPSSANHSLISSLRYYTGKAPDADQMFAPVAVPLVQDPTDRQQDPPPASFLAAPPMDPRQSSRRSGSSQGISTSANKALASSSNQDQRSDSISSQTSFFRTSTPSFQFDRPFFANHGRGNGATTAAATTSTPIESQGAAFRFGEAEERGDAEVVDGEDRRIRARSRETSAGPRMSDSIEDGPPPAADDSSFWNPGVARKGKAAQRGTTGGNGLFDFAHSAKSAPLFGQGLLFGQNGSSKQEFGRSGSISAGSGGFFTPANVQNGSIENADIVGGQAMSKLINGRPPPGIKRSINQIDESAPDDSFHFQSQAQQRRQQQLGGSTNGLTGHTSGDVEEILIDEVDAMTPANGFQSATAPIAGRPGFVRKQSHLLNKLGHGGMNGNHHSALETSSTGAASFASKANRIVSNPREKKRSRAGPSNYDDASTATTTSSSHSISTNSALYPASSSSPPPAGQSENDPQGYVPSSIALHQDHAMSRHNTGITTSLPHKSTPMATTSNLAVSQPLAAVPSADRVSSYRKQVEAAQNALAENWLRGIFRLFAKAQACMSRYDCAEVSRAVLSLPKEQRNSTRAVLLLGEAAFESLDYAKVSFIRYRGASQESLANSFDYTFTLVFNRRRKLFRPSGRSHHIIPQRWRSTQHFYGIYTVLRTFLI